MSEWRLWRGFAILTAALYGSLAWFWFTQLVPGADGLIPFDGRLMGYSVAEARAFLDALTEPARVTYLGVVRILDTVFPICLAALLAWPLWRLPSGTLRVLGIIPVAYLAADLTENTLVAGMLRSQELVAPDVIELASQITVAKYAFLITSVIALGAVFMRTRRP
ncbi:MAG: hypothetical protein JKY00_01760 [Roseicyclus sp.]|nr:hypothetical protein [Roseicyclus sp.]